MFVRFRERQRRGRRFYFCFTGQERWSCDRRCPGRRKVRRTETGGVLSDDQRCPSEIEPRPARLLEVSVCATHRWSDGKVRHEHVASVGSIPLTMTNEDRFRFWLEVDKIIARGSNRIDWHVIAPMIEARIPRVIREAETELILLRREHDALNDSFVAGCLSGRRLPDADKHRMVAVAKRIEELEAAQAAPEPR